MDYYKKVFETYRSEIMKNQWLQYGSRRKRFLGELKTKEAKRLVKYVENKRFICFCTSIEQANELGGKYAIHSKSDSKALGEFNSLKSNKLFAVNMLQEGMNLKGIEVGIIIQLDGQKLRFIQRTGRVLRSDFPVQYILYFKNTRDEEYLVNALEGINEEYVKEFKYEDNN
jgi:superfamily II DNA or RNA helicase